MAEATTAYRAVSNHRTHQGVVQKNRKTIASVEDTIKLLTEHFAAIEGDDQPRGRFAYSIKIVRKTKNGKKVSLNEEDVAQALKEGLGLETDKKHITLLGAAADSELFLDEFRPLIEMSYTKNEVEFSITLKPRFVGYKLTLFASQYSMECLYKNQKLLEIFGSMIYCISKENYMVAYFEKEVEEKFLALSGKTLPLGKGGKFKTNWYKMEQGKSSRITPTKKKSIRKTTSSKRKRKQRTVIPKTVRAPETEDAEKQKVQAQEAPKEEDIMMLDEENTSPKQEHKQEESQEEDQVTPSAEEKKEKETLSHADTPNTPQHLGTRSRNQVSPFDESPPKKLQKGTNSKIPFKMNNNGWVSNNPEGTVDDSETSDDNPVGGTAPTDSNVNVDFESFADSKQ